MRLQVTLELTQVQWDHVHGRARAAGSEVEGWLIQRLAEAIEQDQRIETLIQEALVEGAQRREAQRLRALLLLNRITRQADRRRQRQDVAVLRVDAGGLWLWLSPRVYYLPFDDFPSFRDAPAAHLFRVDWPCEELVRWPLLDVEVSLGAMTRSYPYTRWFRG